MKIELQRVLVQNPYGEEAASDIDHIGYELRVLEEALKYGVTGGHISMARWPPSMLFALYANS